MPEAIKPTTFKRMVTSGSLNLRGYDLATMPDMLFEAYGMDWDLQPGKIKPLLKVDMSENELSDLDERFGKFNTVTSVQMSKNLFSNIPAVLLTMPSLSKLELAKNKIEAVDPDIGQVKQLKYLDLSNNFITLVPAAMTDLSALSTLLMSHNSIKTITSLALERLVTLDLSHNDIKSVADGAFSACATIISVDLSYNKLTSLPAGLDKCKTLQTLNISYNLLGDIAGDFSGSALHEVVLTRNEFVKFPPAILTMGAMTTLKMDYNKLEALPDDINEGLPKLINLDVTSNALRNLPPTLALIPTLKFVFALGNIIRVIPDKFLQKGNKELLDFLKKRAMQAGASMVQHEANKGHKHEGKLAFVNGDLTKFDASASAIKNIGGLHELSLAKNSLEEMPDLSYLSGLSKLIMSKNKLKSIHPSIVAAERLEFLDLDANDIRSTAPLAAHPKLHTLTISYNSDLVVDALPLTLTHLTLENSGLTEFPPAVLKLREMVVLNVGRNKIAAFPARPMRMPHLKQLNIQSCDIRRLPGYLAGTMKLDRIFTDMCPLRQPNQQIISKGMKEINKWLKEEWSRNPFADDGGDDADDGKVEVPAVGTTLPPGEAQSSALKPKVKKDRKSCSIKPIDWKIKMSAQKLTGVFDVDDVYDPQSVRDIDISKNALESLGDDWSEFVACVTLLANKNKIDAIPASFVAMEKLETLELSGNRVKSTGHLAGHPRLKKLDLGYNVGLIIAALPEGLNDLTLENCALTKFPVAVLWLNNLSSLNISRNPIKDLPAKQMGHLTSLKQLDIQGCDIKTLDPWLYKLKLKSLILLGCPIKNPSVAIVKKGLKNIQAALRERLKALPEEEQEFDEPPAVSGAVAKPQSKATSSSGASTAAAPSAPTDAPVPKKKSGSIKAVDWKLKMSAQKMSVFSAHDVDAPEKVKEIDISKNSLESLPDEMASFVTCTTLLANKNKIAEIPLAIVAMEALDTCELSGNKICSSAPFAGHPKIKKLNLGYNMGIAIEGALPSTLTELQLENCGLTEFPIAVLWLDSLSSLNVGRNPIKDLPAKQMGHLTSLKQLDIQGCDIKKLDPWLYKLKLKSLILIGCPIKQPSTAIVKKGLKDIQAALRAQLKSLPEEEQEFEDPPPLSGAASKPRVAKPAAKAAASPTAGGDEGPPKPKKKGGSIKAENWKVLMVAKKLTSFPADDVAQPETVKEIDVSKNLMTTLPAEMADFTVCTILRANKCRLEEVPASLVAMEALTTLELSGNSITSTGALGEHPTLRKLDMGYNVGIAVEGALPSTLTELKLENCGLTEFPTAILYLSDLSALNVSRNRIVDLPVRQMGKMTSLAQLDIQGCDIKKLGPWLGQIKLKSFICDGCPIKQPSQGIVKKGMKVVMAALNEQLKSLPEEEQEFEDPPPLSGAASKPRVAKPAAKAAASPTAGGDEGPPKPKKKGGSIKAENWKVLMVAKKLTSFPADDVAQPETVKEIDVSKNLMTTLPAEMADFTVCTILRANKCRLEEVPASLVAMEALTTLELSGNSITSTGALGEHPTLRKLDMGYNRGITVGSLPSTLTELALENSALEEFPTSILRLANLSSLNVGRNPISVLPVRQMGKMESLSQLAMQNCNVKNLDPWLSKIKLKSFVYDGCPIKQPSASVMKKGMKAIMMHLAAKLKELPPDEQEFQEPQGGAAPAPVAAPAANAAAPRAAPVRAAAVSKRATGASAGGSLSLVELQTQLDASMASRDFVACAALQWQIDALLSGKITSGTDVGGGGSRGGSAAATVAAAKVPRAAVAPKAPPPKKERKPGTIKSHKGVLDLSNKRLEAFDEEEVVAPETIKTLNLSNNKIEQLPNMSAWTELKTLIIFKNKVFHSIPESIVWMVGLETLELSTNALTSTSALAAHPCLKTLDVSYNAGIALDGLPASLTDLRVENCGVEEVPASILALTGMRTLKLCRNPMKDLPAEEMARAMPSLATLDISYTDIKKLSPHLAAMPLKSFTFAGCPIKQPSKNILAKDVKDILKYLKEQLDKLPKSDHPPAAASAAAISSAAGSGGSAAAPPSAGVVVHRTGGSTNAVGGMLNLAKKGLDAFDADDVNDPSTVKEIILSHNSLETLPDMNAFIGVEVLKLTDTFKFTSIHPSVAAMLSLRTLDLSTNSIKTFSLPTHPALAELTLSNNKNIEINALPVSLKVLRLENVEMAEIPSAIFTLGQLTMLSVARNNLTALPGDEIGQHLYSLQDLDISYTKIKRLPAELAMLEELKKLRMDGCKILQPSKMVIAGGMASIMEYLGEQL